GWSRSGTKVSLALSTLFIFLYAISDEVHQYFVPMREASVIDVLIDTAGGLIGVAAVLLSIRALAGPVNQRGKQGGGA
ncbi:MAG: VanZ family protein, partial [Thermoplasmata archaeon]